MKTFGHTKIPFPLLLYQVVSSGFALQFEQLPELVEYHLTDHFVSLIWSTKYTCTTAM